MPVKIFGTLTQKLMEKIETRGPGFDVQDYMQRYDIIIIVIIPIPVFFFLLYCSFFLFINIMVFLLENRFNLDVIGRASFGFDFNVSDAIRFLPLNMLAKASYRNYL